MCMPMMGGGMPEMPAQAPPPQPLAPPPPPAATAKSVEPAQAESSSGVRSRSNPFAVKSAAPAPATGLNIPV